MAENKRNLGKLRIKLDKAIDDGNMEDVDMLLNEILSIDEDSIEPDNCFEFAQSIRCKNKKGGITMKRKFNFKRMAVIAAAIAAISVVGVSGSMLIKQYSYTDGDKFYTLSVDGNLDNETLNRIEESIKSGRVITDPADLTDGNPDASAEPTAAEEKNFKSVKEAEEYYDMRIPLPEIMPDLELKDIKGEKFSFGENSSSSEVWATYGDFNKKAFGITVKKSDFETGVSSLASNDMDEGSHSEYVSSKGYKFDKFNESDESKERTANIYSISKDNYQYSLVFYNFSEDETRGIVDSFDL